MSINRTILLGAAAMVVLVAMALPDPAYARRDTTVDQCPPDISCGFGVSSPGEQRSSDGPTHSSGDDTAGDDSGPDDSDDTSTDDTVEDDAPVK